MSLTTFYRVSAVALLVGGLLGGAGYLVHPDAQLDPFNAPVHFALFFAIHLIMLGLPGLIAFQMPRIGKLGIVGGTMTGLGITLDLLHAVPNFTYDAVLRADPALRPMLLENSDFTQKIESTPFAIAGMLILTPLLLFGFMVLAIAVVRAKVLPRWVGWTLFACPFAILSAASVPALVGWDHLGSILASPVYFGPAMLGAAMLTRLHAAATPLLVATPAALFGTPTVSYAGQHSQSSMVPPGVPVSAAVTTPQIPESYSPSYWPSPISHDNGPGSY